MIDHEYSLSIVTAATENPITTAELKAHCRVDNSDEDTLIAGLGTAATKHLETVMDRAFCTQTLRLSLPRWPDSEILLPRAPLVSVSSITYTDSGGTSQTWGSSNYQVDTYHLPGRIWPAFGASWPTVRSETVNPITVQYVAGYGAAAAVPQPIKQAILLLAAHWFENREAVVVGVSASPLPMAVESLIWSYRSF